MVCADLNASMENHRGATQKIVGLEGALRITREEERQLKDDVYAKSTLFATVRKQADEKSKAYADIEVVPTLSLNDMKELKRYEQIMLEMQSSLRPDTWMGTD